jgi:hypothetical protein
MIRAAALRYNLAGVVVVGWIESNVWPVAEVALQPSWDTMCSAAGSLKFARASE